jgi:hypothetical protein
MNVKKTLSILLFIVGFALTGCDTTDEKTADVMFMNNSTDIVFHYGIALGQAKYEGVLNPGDYTDYYSTKTGTYTVKGKTNIGDWITVSTGAFEVGEHSYALCVEGSTVSGSFQLIRED